MIYLSCTSCIFSTVLLAISFDQEQIRKKLPFLYNFMILLLKRKISIISALPRSDYKKSNLESKIRININSIKTFTIWNNIFFVYADGTNILCGALKFTLGSRRILRLKVLRSHIQLMIVLINMKLKVLSSLVFYFNLIIYIKLYQKQNDEKFHIVYYFVKTQYETPRHSISKKIIRPEEYLRYQAL